MDSTGIKAVLLERLEQALAGDADAPSPAAADDEEELEDIPDDDAPAAEAAEAGDDLEDIPDADPKSPAEDAKSPEEDAPDAAAPPAKSDEEVAAERAALVALVEADIQKRKERAERFGMPFEPTELDKKRLECAREGRPMPGSKEEAEANARRKKIPKPKQQQGEKGASRDARFQNERKKTKGVASKEDICRNCGKAGHWARDCWAPGGGKEGQKPGQQKKGQKGQQQQQQQAKKQPQQQQQQNKRKSEGDAKEAREAKMKKRYEAFGTSAALKEVDPEWEAKLAARAARFAAQ